MTATLCKTRTLIAAVGILTLGAGAIMYASYMRSLPVYIDPSDSVLVTQGRQLYANNCAACHGAAD